MNVIEASWVLSAVQLADMIHQLWASASHLQRPKAYPADERGRAAEGGSWCAVSRH